MQFNSVENINTGRGADKKRCMVVSHNFTKIKEKKKERKKSPLIHAIETRCSRFLAVLNAFSFIVISNAKLI